MAPSTVKSNGSADPFRTLVRHGLYYISSADLCFLLGHVQFRVHRYFFERESAYFRAKLSLPVSPGATRQGSNDQEPIVFDDVTPEDFERLCWVFYNPRYSLYDGTVEDWTAILSLAHKWAFPQVKALAIRELEKKELDHIDKIVWYHANDVDRNLLIPHYAALCARETPLTLPEGIRLGMETTLVIASAREYVRAAKLADGSRSPISPTVEGEELADLIRDVFGIALSSAANRPDEATLASVASSSPTKDVLTASASSVGTKTEVDTSSSTLTASATIAAGGKTPNATSPSGDHTSGGDTGSAPNGDSTAANGGANGGSVEAAAEEAATAGAAATEGDGDVKEPLSPVIKVNGLGLDKGGSRPSTPTSGRGSKLNKAATKRK